jgi:hypothetical protein
VSQRRYPPTREVDATRAADMWRDPGLAAERGHPCEERSTLITEIRRDQRKRPATRLDVSARRLDGRVDLTSDF